MRWEDLARVAGYQPAALAKVCGVSLRTLQRHFRTTHNATISDFLRKIRLNEAYQRLEAGERVKKVAFDLNYKQLSHFSREFKRVYGVPPSVFSMRHQGQWWQVLPLPQSTSSRLSAPVRVTAPAQPACAAA